MRLLIWVAALAVLSLAFAKNLTAKAKPKRQLESIRTPQNLQYSLVLPHSRVTQFRALSSERRYSNISPRNGNLPPYAVQMEPVVQYSQKDPLYDPSLDSIDDAVVNKNEIFAQPKILNVHDQAAAGSYGPPYGSLPTAPLYSHEPYHQPHYYEAPEPIIEIIIKESNETLPAPPPPPVQKKKKEPVHVFYVKYSKDPHHKDKVIYEKPIPAITPPTNEEEDHHHEDYVTVTPEPYLAPQQTTTLRAIIKPESEQYHSDGSVKITFGSEDHGHSHYSDRREGGSHSEDHEETAPRPAIAYPQHNPTHPPLERSASAKPQDVRHSEPSRHGPQPQHYRPGPQHAQSRIQYQPQIYNEQQLPRQGPSVAPFRGNSRQNQFNPLQGIGPTFASLSGPPHFSNNVPTAASPHGPSFPSAFPRPNNGPSFHPRPSNAPSFGPRPQFHGPPRPNFNPGPQRPFHQPQAFFDEPKYLQENYHTITTDQVEPPKDQVSPNRPQPNFHLNRPGPNPPVEQFQEQFNRPQFIPLNQQLPQQRPPQHFVDPVNKPSFQSSSNRPSFLHLKPSPPHIEDNRPPFHQPQQQPPFSFHQGVQSLSKPTIQLPPQQNSFQNFAPTASPIPQHQFLPQPSSPTLFNFHAHPSQAPDQQFAFQQNFNNPSERPQFPHSGPSERPQFASQGPSERPQFASQGPSERPPQNFQDQSFHQQNVAQFVPNGGELVPSISKYEQHITVAGPTSQPDYSSLSGPSQPTPTASHPQPQYQQQQQQIHQQREEHHRQQLQNFDQQQRQQQQNHEQQQRQQQQNHEQQQRQQQQNHEQQQHQQQQNHEQQQREQQHRHAQQQQPTQQQIYEAEQEQVRQQLAQNVQKQQEEIQRLQNQLNQAQKDHHEAKKYEQSHNNYQQQQYQQKQIQTSSPKSKYSQERSKAQQPNYVSSTSSPLYHSHYQSTSRPIDIKPTTQKYVSSTVNSINTTPDARKEERKKKPNVVLPDEVPDDLRQQLLSSGILDNADISILDYDKVGDTPLESLPPDQLANFFSAGGAQQIAASENKPIVVAPSGERIQSRIDDEDDQELAASENVPSYVAAPGSTQKQAVEMKVVHFDPKTLEGQKITDNYVKDDATQVDPVALNDKKYNRYLPLKVSGNQFPLPDILKGRKITSVVVLAPVATEALNSDHARAERAATESLKGIKFVAGESLQDLLRKPTKDNFEKWLEAEKKTSSDSQSVVLLVTGNDELAEEREIYMYDISSGNVNKLSGELSNAFVEAAENNSLSRDIEKLAIEGEGTPEKFNKESSDEDQAEASETVPFLVDLSGLSLEQENSNQVSISSGYSKTKLGRSLKRL